MLSRPASHLAALLSVAAFAVHGPARAAADPCVTLSCPSIGAEGRDDDDSGLIPLVLAGLGLIGGALLIDSLTGKDWASPAKLDRDGPIFPKRQALGRFQVQGYALPGWPVVVDIETRPGTETWLVVRYRGAKKDLPRIPIPGQGRRVQVVHLPQAAGPIRTARYSLHSFRSKADGKTIYQPHNVFALGAGPRAVGSTTLQISQLSPAVARQAADVHYSLFAKRLFDRSVVEVLRLPRKHDGKLKLVKDARLFPLRPGSHPGNWRTMKVQPSPAAGLYHFQARAWLVGGRNDERDWTGAIAPNFVRIP